jgi:iron complex transport system ATP-binding protein
MPRHPDHRALAEPPAQPEPPVIDLRGVAVRRGQATILGPIDWVVRRGERWVVVGPNGSGKTTLLQVVSTYLWPSGGRVSILGSAIGSIDARELRRRIGYASPALAAALPGELSALDVVTTARHAALAPWWHTYTAADRDRATGLLERLGCGSLAGRSFATLSSGERQRVQIARALMAGPDLLLLDEPAAALDLGARELLIERLEHLAADESLAGVVLVTHHVEEIPPGFGHGLVLRAGRAVAAGRLDAVLDGRTLSAAYGMPLRVGRDGGRFSARRDA